MESDPHLFSNLKSYFKQSFEWWTMTESKKFYKICYWLIKPNFCFRYPKSISDFDDIFNTSMEKFAIAMQERKYHFENNSHAYNTFRKFFLFARIDHFRKTTIQQKNLGTYIKVQPEEESFESVLVYEIPCIEILFDRMDKVILHTPSLMTQRQKEFYYAFKKAILSFNNDDEVKSHVMSELKIKEGYFAKLKTEIIYILKRVIGNTNFLN